jgi:hypothetical protein
LALLCLVHVGRWARARAFVRAGGLSQLAALFADESVALRSQAVQAFLAATAHPDYDWMTRAVFVGQADSKPDATEIHIFEVVNNA